MSDPKKLNKTFIYLVPKRCNKKYNPCTELILIHEFIRLGYHIIPIYHLYIINVLFLILTRKIDGIIVNSINILWKNRLLLKLNLTTPIYWWYFDNPFLREKNNRQCMALAKNVAVFYNKHINHFNNYIKSGINPVWLDQGITDECQFVETDYYKYDIVFFGSLNIVHDTRTKLLKKMDKDYNLAIFTTMKNKFKELGFKNVFEAVKHNKIGEIVSQTKITLVLNATTKEAYCWSNRIHLMLGSGAFCLTDYIHGLEKSYVDGEECIFVKKLESLKEVVEYWISDDKINSRNEIRINGYKRAHAEHSYENRIKSLISNIES